ncbi:hypothetical protein ABVT39_014826 [Epinephelus coioides]
MWMRSWLGKRGQLGMPVLQQELEGEIPPDTTSEPEPDILPLVLSELVNYTVETSLSSYGAAISSQPSVSQKQRVLLTGDGGRLMKNGGSSGQPIHQLQRVVNNSPSVAANQGAVQVRLANRGR